MRFPHFPMDHAQEFLTEPQKGGSGKICMATLGA